MQQALWRHTCPTKFKNRHVEGTCCESRDLCELGGGRPPSLPGHPQRWDGGGHWVIRVLCSFLIESKPPVFQLSLPPKQTFSGWLIPMTEWMSAGSAILYQLARHFHLVRRSSCSSTSKRQSQEVWRESFRVFTDALSPPRKVGGPWAKEHISPKQFRTGLIC